VSQQNVEIVRGLFERWNRGERDFSDDEVDATVQIQSRFQGEPYRGRDGLLRWMRDIDDHFSEWRLVVDEWRERGDKVIALGRVRLRGEGSGLAFDQPMGWLIEVRDGRLLSLQTFPDPARALIAAGLRE
jgi:ketosteroid isomerase-like protein